MTDEEITERHRNGGQISKIARAANVPYGTMYDRMVKLGIVKPMPKREARQMPIDVSNVARVNRDPCPRCATRADVGCRHVRVAA